MGKEEKSKALIFKKALIHLQTNRMLNLKYDVVLASINFLLVPSTIGICSSFSYFFHNPSTTFFARFRFFLGLFEQINMVCVVVDVI